MQIESVRSSLLILSLLALGLAVPTPGLAKSKVKGKSCAAAEALFQATGVGDRDGDGLTDCRERKQLHTQLNNADTDGDGIPDGEEVKNHTDPRDADSDHDGIPDGDDDTPEMPKQEVEAFLDALTCPQVGVLGAITALGITATLDDQTEFEHVTCDELTTQLTAGGHPFVEIKVLEDSQGALTTIEVEIEEND